MTQNTALSEMPLVAWTLDYNPFDAVGMQPQDMLPRPPPPEVFRHALHAALYVARQAPERGVSVPYTLAEVWLASVYLQQADGVVGHETLDPDAWAWNFDELVVRGAGSRYTRRWAPERLRPRAAVAGMPLTFDLSSVSHYFRYYSLLPHLGES